MSKFDLAAVAIIVCAGLVGLRRGLVVALFSLAGLAVGFYLGSQVVPSLLGREMSRWLPLVALGGAIVCAALGQALGAVAGRNLRRALAVLGPLRFLDNLGGGVFGATLGLALCWAVGAAFLYLPGQTELRRHAQASSILASLNEQVPPQRLIDALVRIDPFVALTGPAAMVGPPDSAILASAGVTTAALSVVRVIGTACGLGVEGSGWVAGPGLVVTNAHVVAGVRRPLVDRNDGDTLEARVVSFDQLNDVAVLRVDGLSATPLGLAEAARGTPGGLLGYPANGPFAETAVRVGRVVRMIGRDAYGRFRSAGG